MSSFVSFRLVDSVSVSQDNIDKIIVLPNLSIDWNRQPG